MLFRVIAIVRPNALSYSIKDRYTLERGYAWVYDRYELIDIRLSIERGLLYGAYLASATHDALNHWMQYQGYCT